MDKFKIVLFLFTAPIVYGAALILHFTFGGADKNDWLWYQKVWHKKGAWLEKMFAVLVTPFYLLMWFGLRNLYPMWEELMD